MRQPLDQTRHDIFTTTVFRCYFVADVQDILPILGGQILVGRLGYGALNVSKSPANSYARVVPASTSEVRAL
jgi:hypothetical protein